MLKITTILFVDCSISDKRKTTHKNDKLNWYSEIVLSCYCCCWQKNTHIKTKTKQISYTLSACACVCVCVRIHWRIYNSIHALTTTFTTHRRSWSVHVCVPFIQRSFHPLAYYFQQTKIIITAVGFTTSSAQKYTNFSFEITSTHTHTL